MSDLAEPQPHQPAAQEPAPQPELPLERSVYEAGALELAPELLGRTLYRRQGAHLMAGVITETEAYRGALDDASHAFRGPTPRTQVMFGPPGFAYVYFIYGMWNCLNVVCREEGVAEAVLIRAIMPTLGVEQMRVNRPGTRPLADGPGKLCQALAVTRELNGADLCGLELWVGESRLPVTYSTSPRIGIDYATEHRGEHWRFLVEPASLSAAGVNVRSQKA